MNSDKFSLAIWIYGINHGEYEHAYQEVLLSDTEVLGIENAIALVEVAWNTDMYPTSSPEDYTTCVQILVNDIPIGAELCSVMGEF